MKSHDDETLDSVSTLLKKIRGIQAPEKESTGPVAEPRSEKKPGQEDDQGGMGDFSALIQKLNIGYTGTMPGPSRTVHARDDSLPGKSPPPNNVADDLDDLLEDAPPAKMSLASPGTSEDDIRAAPEKIMEQPKTPAAPILPSGKKSALPESNILLYHQSKLLKKIPGKIRPLYFSRKRRQQKLQEKGRIRARN